MDIKKAIKKDGLIKKFCAYGFFRNLRFFEPFLIIYLLSMDLSLFYIGILYSIREITNYIFEIPSGVFADHYGKKTELALCFLLYIVSFVLFFIGERFYVLCIAMVLFGLGEAFRSGTHKAIIMSYLEEKDWFSLKGFVYGRTRSFSLIGSSISSFVSVVFLLSFGSLRLLFLLCIVPYVIDFVLILSYPKRFNEHHAGKFTLKDFARATLVQLKSISRQKAVMKTVVSSSMFNAVVVGIKDYIQPILQAIILGSTITIIKNLSGDDTLSIYLAAIYGVLFLLSAFASRNVYRLQKQIASPRLMHILMDILAIVLLLLALFVQINAIYVIIVLYFIVYILKDARRPLFVDTIGDIMKKKQRVTTLSIESQFRALFVAIFAPLFGFIADTLSISALFVVVGVLCLVLNRFIKPGRQTKAVD
ncbi:MAG: MFS transporter [Clostridia bacterium]|jgi:MFS family permease|nr:MFS transporter [Clostridia bacterium]MBT7122551.1 MFS transporter [Clostridia bacterium]